ncbi:FMN-binding negative transcriptional regulator [Ramlibacter rhizophilus]|uniref:FMN-binding negative transcriptional regulator n=1 Tax=Ramlibacter rhizophilus TaxID=1781167 RepID=A0A4Z0C153_9BURK|nr:FMN-binding negative transcriptional regulator [Ramlibacter rhizophilus]TFZ04951.1 FMN-binding negative transcriptional regulator [Ramlibacter rhizophilus]
MYLPAHFRSDDRDLALALMREQPLASLISVDDSGLPFVSHLPLHAPEPKGGPASLQLLGHCARANPHADLLRRRPRALVTFLGPQAYQSPRIYPDLQRVPSWNYLAVHCTVEARLIDDPGEKDALLKRLIADHEPAYAAQWRSLDERYTRGMLAGIVGLDLTVTHWECKLKLNQHRPESHAALRAGYAAGGEQGQALARWMDRLGLNGDKACD